MEFVKQLIPTLEYKFTNPDFLKLLYLLPIFWVSVIMGFRSLSLWRIFLSVFLRTFVFLLVVLVLAGFGWNEKKKRETCAVFLVDMSDSISQEGREWVLNYVKDIEEGLDENIKKGLVVFGNGSRIVTPTLVDKLDLNSMDLNASNIKINSDKTDIAGGIMAALGIMPESSSKMMVLVSDGNENMGDVYRAATMASNNGVRIFTAAPPTRKENEIFVKNLIVPKDVNEGEMFNVKIIVENKNENPIKGNLTLNQKDNLLKEWDVEFKSGTNVFEVPYKSEEKGTVKFTANLNIKDTNLDKDERNNKRTAFANVSGKARLLFIDGAEQQSSFLAEALKDKAFILVAKGPNQIPKSLNEYLKYDGLILSNVSNKFLSKEQMELIKEYVKDYGGGFVMTCGSNIKAKDGYSNTIIEEVLPVRIIGGGPPKEDNRARLSLVMIIDKSGSMLGKKMLFAKKAAIELIKQLGENDNYGILAFDTIPYKIVDLKPANEVKREIIEKLSMLNADGGTNILPAMEAAYQQLTQRMTRAKTNHVILLSDGNSTTNTYHLNSLIKRFQDAKITVSTVLLGKWLVNDKLLKYISNKTRGHFYRITDIIKLPKLIIQDSNKFIAQSDFHEEHFFPKINRKSQILKGIYNEQLPPLKGYTITEAKKKAEVPLIADTMGKDDPILANWRYGLGKVVIYTSDADARWSSEWINWLKFKKFWSQVVRWSMKDISKTDYNLKVVPEENAISLLIESSTKHEDGKDLKVGLFTSDLKTHKQELTLRQIAPQKFTAKLTDITPGAYTLKITRTKDGKIVDIKTKGLVVPETKTGKPLELSVSGNNIPVLKNIAEITGGKYNPNKEEIVIEEKETISTKDFSNYLIPLAMILFILDIGARKFRRDMV